MDCAVGSRDILGVASGSALAWLGTTTGPLVGLHEVVGHGLLGYEMVHLSGAEGPTYQVDGWDNVKAIGEAKSVQDVAREFFRWIGGYDRNGDGASGYMQYPSQYREFNGIGRAMGPSGASAWCSIAGSLPGMALSIVSVAAGVFLCKRASFPGATLLGFGLTNHTISSCYPMSAAFMSHDELQRFGSQGHDFAGFAIEMSKITGASAEAIAISTAAIWTLAVPLVALFAYLHMKSRVIEIVPDVLALTYWLQKGHQVERYPSRKELEASKKEILRMWEKQLPKDRIQTTFTITAIIGNITTVVTKILRALVPFCAASVQIAARVFTFISPVFLLSSICAASYEIYKDVKCAKENLPKSAKFINVAKLVITVASAILITVSFFVPGLNLLFCATLITTTLINISLSYARYDILKNHWKVKWPDLSKVVVRDGAPLLASR